MVLDSTITDADLQKFRSHIGVGASFLVFGGQRHARVIGLVAQPSRITSMGVVFHVENRPDDLQYMIKLPAQIATDGGIFIRKTKAFREDMATIDALPLLPDPDSRNDTIPGGNEGNNRRKAGNSEIQFAPRNQMKRRTMAVARRLCPSSLLGFLTRLIASASWIFSRAGMLFNAEWAIAPAISPEVKWAAGRGSSILKSPNGCFWENILKRRLSQ